MRGVETGRAAPASCECVLPGRVIAPKKARIVQQQKIRKVSGPRGGRAVEGSQGSSPASLFSSLWGECGNLSTVLGPRSQPLGLGIQLGQKAAPKRIPAL